MRIIALLSWYDEAPAQLTDCISSLAGIADHVVAVDGAYALYPDARAASDRAQHAAIEATACSNGIGCTVHVPDVPWPGNEVEKRDFMFWLAESIAVPNDDWYFVIDGDEAVTQSCDLHAALTPSGFDAGMVTLVTPVTSSTPPASEVWLRKLFRAIPGLGVEGKHWHYRLPDGRYLWHDRNEPRLAPALTVDMRIEHRCALRDDTHCERRRDYYDRRHRACIERTQPVPNAAYVKALETERAQYTAAGNTDGVRNVDAELDRVVPTYRRGSRTAMHNVLYGASNHEFVGSA